MLLVQVHRLCFVQVEYRYSRECLSKHACFDFEYPGPSADKVVVDAPRVVHKLKLFRNRLVFRFPRFT